MVVNVHIGLALLAMRELCKSKDSCYGCPLLHFCSSKQWCTPCSTDPDTFPNLIVKIEIPVDKS